ncbi:hypothetical protein L210DRAFT_2526479 [Boletus edulis BED1]|uniref:FAD-binding domain-containing protein n=1 Tax=Boletus edulis BED1 TaxID=1328754 RepID=A0AAD4BNB9_BOLED|nr:hypothetical protein L210DRAFT_2526479 [Boletus edulis BED1]
MVLIVGAGPAGLNATLSLLHYGVHDIVIVDFILQGDNTSRAAVIHAATIETLDKIGAASNLLARRHQSRGCLHPHMWHLATSPMPISLSSKDLQCTHTPSCCRKLLQRILTEQLRERALNVDVHRPYKVTDMRQNVKDRQVIACPVRRQAGSQRKVCNRSRRRSIDCENRNAPRSVLQLASASEPIRNYCGSLQHRASRIAMQPRRETRSERRGILMPLLNAPSSYHLVWYTWFVITLDPASG